MAQEIEIAWGKVAFVLDDELFRRGYMDGRIYYRLDSGDWEPLDPSVRVKKRLTATELISQISFKDEEGRYQLDMGEPPEKVEEGVERLLGVFAGYLAGPLYPETPEERQEREEFFSGSIDDGTEYTEYSEVETESDDVKEYSAG
ncbi:MAG: hypothetical protein IMW89_03590 [Ktedonobacteraceae bacterium]|nr:hypothetical protein [Ktedonobacteraceae bacterium]